MTGATKAQPARVSLTSADIALERIQALKSIIPEVFTEGRIDLEKLRGTLGDNIEGRRERYQFTWAGKQDSIQILQTPSTATLNPDVSESIDFEKTGNVFIEGENLEVLKLLYKPYFGRIKMIYIDPPYNTGNDFIYRDNFSDPLANYLQLTGQKDSNGNTLTSNPETSGRYHSAWLSMMYPRLFIARNLLKDDGVIFVSIDDNEVHNLRMILNEIFGEENFIATIIWQKVFSPKNTAKYFSEDHDYVLVYAKNADIWTPQWLPRTEEANARYDNPDNDPRGPWSSSDLTARNFYSQGQYEVTSPSGKKFGSGIGRYWRSSYTKFLELDRDNRVWWGLNGDNMPRLKRFLSEVKDGIVPQTLWKHEKVGNTQEAKKELLEYVHFENTENVLNTVKPVRLLQQMLQIATEPSNGDLVLDFFAGSAPMAHAVLQQNREDGGNRRFICVQIPEPLPKPEERLKTIADIGKERIRNVIKKLNGTAEGQSKLETQAATEDLGFQAFKLAISNFRQWNQQPANTDVATYTKQMELFNDPLIGGSLPRNVVYEVAIKEGLSLTSRIKDDSSVKQAVVWKVVDNEKGQQFYISLDDSLSLDSLKSLHLSKDDLFICRNVAVDDTAAANLALQCRLKLI